MNLDNKKKKQIVDFLMSITSHLRDQDLFNLPNDYLIFLYEYSFFYNKPSDIIFFLETDVSISISDQKKYENFPSDIRKRLFIFQSAFCSKDLEHTSKKRISYNNEMEFNSTLDLFDAYISFVGRKEIPFVKQESQMECGAACLTMLMSQFQNIGRYEVRNIVLPTKNGSSLAELIYAAKKYNYMVRVEKSDFLNKPFGRMPFVALTDYHFIIVLDISKNGVEVLDPSLGKRKIPIEVAQNEWSGYCMAISPQFETYKDTPLHEQDQKISLHCLKFFTVALFCMIGISVGEYYENDVLRTIFNKIDNLETITLLQVYTMVVLGVFFVTIFVDQLLLSNFNLHYLKKFKIFINNTLETSSAYLKVINPKDFILRTGDIHKYVDTYLSIPVDFFGRLSILLFSCALLFKIHYLFFIIVILSTLIQGSVIYLLRNLHIKFSQEVTDNSNSLDQKKTEFFNGLDTILSHSFKKLATHKMLALYDRYQSSSMEKVKFHFKLGIFNQFIEKLTSILTIYLALYLYSEKYLGIGDIIVSISLTLAIIEPIINFIIQSTELLELKIVKHRVEGLMSYPKVKDRLYEFIPNSSESFKIDLKQDYFKYPGSFTSFELRKVNIQLDYKMIYSVVGESGSGKSTLLNLIASDIVNFDSNLKRSCITLGANDPIIFGTLEENIKLGYEGYALDNVKEYLSKFWIDKDLQVSDIWNINLYNLKNKLSSGQLQRLLFARVLYLQPKIVLLDECFSSITSSDEELLISKLKYFLPKSLIIYITHRPSLTKYSDQTLFLEDGNISAQGHYSELMISNNDFRNLYLGTTDE